MLNLQSELYEQYQFDYKAFIAKRPFEQYLQLTEKADYSSESASLLKYPGRSQGEEIFLVVPSIFNSPEILFLNEENNFVDNIQQEGDIYIVNWLENSKLAVLEDYVREVQKIIEFLMNNTGKKINLVGHCLGGNICAAVATSKKYSHALNHLTLLTCPWDYAHFNKWSYFYNLLNLEQAINHLDYVPPIYTQMMFFMMFPLQFQEKIDKYFMLQSEEIKNLFMKVERWLQSGSAITKSVYRQIMHDFCQNNLLLNKQWSVDGELVDLANIDKPVCIIWAKDDQIVPLSAIMPLQKQIKNSTLIEVEGGHIGYLVKDDHNFQTKYKNWLINQD